MPEMHEVRPFFSRSCLFRSWPISRLLSILVSALCLFAYPSLAQEVSFSLREYETREFPFSVSAGDVNNDGFLDICSADYLGNVISLFIARGDGTFASAETLVAGLSPRDIVITDFDRDGFQDIIVSNQRTGTVSMLRGSGGNSAASFSLTTVYANRSPWGIVTGDYNRDGVLDLMVSDGLTRGVTRILGEPGGVLGSSRTYGTGSEPYNLVQGDFDEDGLQDLAVANLGSASVTVLGGSFSGDFVPMTTLASPRPYAISTGDINGDQHLDIITGNYDRQTVMVYAGDGRGGFLLVDEFVAGEWITAVTPIELNGDGRMDLVVLDITRGYTTTPGRLYYYLGQGDGRFFRGGEIATGRSPFRVIAADFDNDEVPDLALVNSIDRSMMVLINETYEATGTREGAVNGGAGGVVDVLFLNGEAGTGDDRRVEYNILSSFELRMRRPPAVVAPAVAPYAVYAWPGNPTDNQTAILPLQLGRSAMPMPIGGGPDPPVIWNNVGRFNRLGFPTRSSEPAPGSFLTRPEGLRRAGVFFIQGIIFDPGSAASIPASLTNGILAVPVVQ